jgi:hypothetical protein
MNVAGLVEARAEGRYLPAGDFPMYPWQPVKQAYPISTQRVRRSHF